MKNDEMVLAINADRVRSVLSHGGDEGPLHTAVSTVTLDEMYVLPGGNDARVIGPRSWLETEERYKQPIGYTVVHRDGKILCAKRSKKGGDARLQSKHSIGFGGHVNLNDIRVNGLDGAIANSIRRELGEELALDYASFDGMRTCAMINDDANPVGRVHFGIVSFGSLEDESWQPPVSTEHSEMAWFGPREFVFHSDTLEPWTRILVNDLISEKGRLPRILR